MRTVAFAALLVAALLTTGCQTFGRGLVGASSTPPWDVVPGQSAGPVKIGMKSYQVHRALGVPSEAQATMREIWKYREDLTVAFDGDSNVVGIQMFRPGRVQWKGRTLDGTHTGQDAVSVFGDPDFVSHWTVDEKDTIQYVVYGYRKLGIGVLANPRTDRIMGFIIVVPEGTETPSETTTPQPPPPAVPAPPATP